jgi:hypothetical protein
MPSSLVFRGHDDTGWLHDHWLFKMPMLPSDLQHEHQMLVALRQQNPSTLKEKDYDKLREYCGTERPLIMWLYDFVKEVEGDLRQEPFAWTFEWHITSWYCSEESENAIASSAPHWRVTIRDFEGAVVHKYWSIAFDATFGDLRVIRGKPDYKNTFSKAPWRERSKWLGRVLDAIREHQRIRNFRLRRLGIEVPVN